MADNVSVASSSRIGRVSDAGSERQRYKLRIKSTFIDVSSDHGSLSPRASSDPGSVTCTSATQQEEHYISELTEHMSNMWTPQSQASSRDVMAVGSESGTPSLPEYVPVEDIMPKLQPGSGKKGMNRLELRSHIKCAAREVEKNLNQRRRKAVLGAIQEIPDQVGDVLQRSAMGIVDDLIGEVAVVKDLIEGEATEATAKEQTNIDTAMRNLEVIPEMIQDSFEAYFSKAERTVRARVDNMIQNFQCSGINDNQVVKEMWNIPSEVQEITKQAMQAALVESRVQAQMQIDCALASLPNSGAKLLAEERIIPHVPSEAVMDAKRAVMGTVEHLCTVVESQDNQMPGVANQLVAETLLRAKVESTDALASDEQPQLFRTLNEGSAGHPELCARPCLYFAKGECANGINCNFCHLEHPRRPVHPDKKNRQLLRDMPFSECVAVLAPILQEKVAELGLHGNLTAVMEEFTEGLLGPEARVGQAVQPAQQDGEPLLGGRRKRQLQEFLRSMTLRSVLALLMRAAPSAEQRDGVERFTARLRTASDCRHL